jgi:hypothetical protein
LIGTEIYCFLDQIETPFDTVFTTLATSPMIKKNGTKKKERKVIAKDKLFTPLGRPHHIINVVLPPN